MLAFSNDTCKDLQAEGTGFWQYNRMRNWSQSRRDSHLCSAERAAECIDAEGADVGDGREDSDAAEPRVLHEQYSADGAADGCSRVHGCVGQGGYSAASEVGVTLHLAHEHGEQEAGGEHGEGQDDHGGPQGVDECGRQVEHALNDDAKQHGSLLPQPVDEMRTGERADGVAQPDDHHGGSDHGLCGAEVLGEPGANERERGKVAGLEEQVGDQREHQGTRAANLRVGREESGAC